MDGFHVVICGGGVAAIEGLLRLRSLAGDRVEVTLVAPNEEFGLPAHCRERGDRLRVDPHVSALGSRPGHRSGVG